MKTCTFFGHRDCPGSVKPYLRAALVELIERHGVEQFYVGRQGAFDRMALSVLRELAEKYPHICYAVVLERLPGTGGRLAVPRPDETIFPSGLESVPPRWAVLRRNEWMLKRADYVVTYVTHSWGGAARFAKKAARQKKAVLNLSHQAAGTEKEP